MTRKADKQFRNEWLRACAPFRAVPVEDVLFGRNGAQSITTARAETWIRERVTHCVIDRSGHHWICYAPKFEGDKTDLAQKAKEDAESLNDESLLAIMTHGTQAEKLSK